MYCSKCGSEIASQAVMCPACGNYIGTPSLSDSSNARLMKVLLFLIPIAGLVVYLLKYDSDPKAAKEFGLASLLGAATFFYFYLLYLIFIFTFIGILLV